MRGLKIPSLLREPLVHFLLIGGALLVFSSWTGGFGGPPVQTPNADTPYSWLGLDLRAEPMVLTVPPIEKGRYFSIQLIDLYTHNFDYIGSRTTGDDGGRFLVAGPGWRGDAPAGIKQVFQSETQLAVAVYRWSVTMYELPESLLVANPIDRYLLNSTMLADFVRDADGGITLYVQHDSPGKAREPNWLPAPEGPFSVVTRLYWPEPEALDGTWKQPPMMRVQ